MDVIHLHCGYQVKDGKTKGVVSIETAHDTFESADRWLTQVKKAIEEMMKETKS